MEHVRDQFSLIFDNRGVCFEILEVQDVVALMEGVILVDGLKRSVNALIAPWIFCGVVVLIVLIPSYVVVTRGVGVS